MLEFLKQSVWNCLTSYATKVHNVAFIKCVSFHSGNAHTTSRSNQKLHTGSWSILFFGSDDFALHSFKIFNERYRSKNLIKRLEVVTAYKGKENALINYANKNGILVHTWPLSVPITQFDLGVVVSFGHMIPTEVINAFPLGMINVHASSLPKLRGAAPIIRAIMNGDSQTGVTIMRIMPEKFDIGEILAQEETTIHPDETMPELYTKLAKLGANLLIKTVEKLPDVLHEGREQNNDEATYARKITATASVIRWDKMSAKNVYDLQRALTGLYSLTTKFEDKTIKLHGIRVHEEPISFASFDEEKPGCALYDRKKNLLLIQCKDKTWISVDEIVIPGRKAMSGKDFRNGFMSKYNKSSIIFH